MSLDLVLLNENISPNTRSLDLFNLNRHANQSVHFTYVFQKQIKTPKFWRYLLENIVWFANIV